MTMVSTTATTEHKPYVKWLVLTLAGLTNAITVAVPGMAMSVLFAEISADLNLTLTQVGIVWGIGSVTAIITSLLGGGISDKVGPRKMLIFGALGTGLFGAMRGFSNGFIFLIFATLIYSFFTPLITMNGLKASRLWFPPKLLGSSGGLLSMGMALGFFLSSRFSATLVSPAVGGWRNTLIVYGIIGALMAIPWLLSPKDPLHEGEEEAQLAQENESPSLLASMKIIASNPNNWFIAFGLLGLGGSIQAALGYIPLYLRGAGWEAVQADNALASFHLISMIMTLPLAFLSDRVKSKKRMLIAMMSVMTIGIAILSFAEGSWVWAAILFAGCVRDAFMSVILAMAINARGVTPQLGATAIGFAFMFNNIGNLVMPWIGNSIGETHPSASFLFWAGCGLLSIIAIFFVKE